MAPEWPWCVKSKHPSIQTLFSLSCIASGKIGGYCAAAAAETAAAAQFVLLYMRVCYTCVYTLSIFQCKWAVGGNCGRGARNFLTIYTRGWGHVVYT